MSNSTQHKLTDAQLEVLLHSLSRFSDRITKVGLFGSRATGKARANSDIDLVLYGDVDEALVDRVWTLMNESDLAFQVDVNAYDLLDHAPLKAHIDQVMKPLFTQDKLKAYALEKFLESRIERAMQGGISARTFEEIEANRLAEIEAIKDEDIDTSEIPERNEAFFKTARLVMPSTE